MTVELLKNLSTVSFIIAAVMLIVAIILFFAFDIRSVYGILSGKTEKKAIENIRRQSEADDKKASDKYAASRTDKISPSGSLGVHTSDLVPGMKTADIGTNQLTFDKKDSHSTELYRKGGNETTLLTEDSNETTLLTEETSETTLLQETTSETTLLDQTMASDGVTYGETSVLIQEEAKVVVQEAPVYGVLSEITFMESTEIIA